ncbi:MAG: septal ring lytic transglycosylase RlpA family protein [Solirubrobacteraceae bacterium]
MLALPASAFAFAGTTAADSPNHGALPIRVNPAQVRVGQAVRISGTTLRAQAGQHVTLQSRVGVASAWRSLQSTTVGPLGGFTFTAHLRYSSLVRVIASQATRSQSTGVGAGAAPISGGSTTAAHPVAVTAQVSAGRGNHAVLAGGRVTVHGRVLPVAAARSVQLQGHAGRHWQTLATARTGGSGRFTLGYHAQSGTNRMLRVLFAGDAANARASSAAGTVTVYQPAVASWYYDAGLATGCGFNARYGVANKTLPCGTKVQFKYGGRTVMATVDDRGPYVSGRTWDLGQSTRAALGFDGGVGTVWASVQ